MYRIELCSDVNIRYENRNGKTYAYRSTSRRVPGKDNPVSIKEYLGVVDPSTEEIIDKRPRSNTDAPLKRDLCVKSYGDSLIVHTVAEGLGLLDDIREVFGDRAPDVSSVALAYALCQLSSSALSTVVSSSYIGELAGRGSPFMTKMQAKEALDGISQQRIEQFFALRHARSRGRAFFYAYPTYTPEGHRHPIRGMSDVNIDDSRVCLMSLTETGMPLGYSVIADKMEKSRALTERIIGICLRHPEAVLISDTLLSPMLDLPLLIASGVNFALPFVGTSQRYRDVEPDYRDVSDPRYLRRFDRDEYYLKEGRSGIRVVGDGYETVPESDPGFSGAQHSIRTFMCYDPRMRADAERSMKSVLSELRSNLVGNLSSDPEKDLVLTAGPYSRFLKVDLDDEGRMRVTTRRKEIAEFHRDAGKTVVFLSTSGWDDIIAGRIARTRFTNALDARLRDPPENEMHRGSRADSNPQFFVDYISMCIHIELRSRMDRKHVKDVSVRDALAIASTYRLVIDGDSMEYSRDRNVGRILRILDIPDSVDSIDVRSNPEVHRGTSSS